MDDAGFFEAIRRRPFDPASRLIYADWLDEHGDSRAALIRLEERMRELPVFSDEYDRLELERDRLRTVAGQGWVAALGYDLPTPTLAHGWPDGYRGRSDVLRALADNWYGPPAEDLNLADDRAAGLAALAQIRMPDWLYGFVALQADYGRNTVELSAEPYFDDELDAVVLVGESPSHGGMCAVRAGDAPSDDPPVLSYEPLGGDPNWRDRPGHLGRLTDRLLGILLGGGFHGCGVVDASAVPREEAERAMAWFGPLTPGRRLRIGERPGLFAAFEPAGLFGARIRLAASERLAREAIPPWAWELCRRRDVLATGVFADEHARWRLEHPPEPGEIPF